MPVGPGSSGPTPGPAAIRVAEEHDDADERQQKRRGRGAEQQHAAEGAAAAPAQRTREAVHRREHDRDDERGDDEFGSGRQEVAQVGGDGAGARYEGPRSPANGSPR